jgi:hypothetical protein
MREMPVLTASCPIHDQVGTLLQGAGSLLRLHALLVQVGGAIGTLLRGDISTLRCPLLWLPSLERIPFVILRRLGMPL